jgi:hypothetical protein
MGQSKNVHAHNGDRSVFPTRCDIRRSKDESAYGRERPRLWLPRATAALVVPALCLGSAEQNQIISGSVWYLGLIRG